MEETNINLHSASISEIQSFFKDATVFITGATGFLGHVLLSKLLRSCSNIKEIYILLREKKGKTAINRFNELLEDEVFEVLRNECPESLLKIKPIIGDCLEIGLGLSFNDTEMIKKNVNVIFHVAATVKFDTPIKKAVHMNIRSTSDLLDLAHEIKELKAFVHISTAFSNCIDREQVAEIFYDPPISYEKLIALVDRLDDEILERITPGLLGNFPNTYVFTKAIAENACKIKGADLPLAIFRPAIVISCVKEPIPGWINNIYGPTGIVTAAAVGLLRVLHADKKGKANIVPCDMVVNAAIASAWSVGTKKNKSNEITSAISNLSCNGNFSHDTINKSNITNGIISNENLLHKTALQKNLRNEILSNKMVINDNLSRQEMTKNISIYNFTCDLMKNPFTWDEFLLLNEKQEPVMPSSLSIWAYTLILCRSKTLSNIYSFLFHIIPAFIVDNIAMLLGKEPKLMAAYEKLHKLCAVLSYFSIREWKFTNDNVEILWSRLSAKDKKLFNFNLNSVNWDVYFYTHCVGIRKFILKEKADTIPAALRRRKMLKIAHYCLLSTLTFFLFYICFVILKQLMKQMTLIGDEHYGISI